MPRHRPHRRRPSHRAMPRVHRLRASPVAPQPVPRFLPRRSLGRTPGRRTRAPGAGAPHGPRAHQGATRGYRLAVARVRIADSRRVRPARHVDGRAVGGTSRAETRQRRRAPARGKRRGGVCGVQTSAPTHARRGALGAQHGAIEVVLGQVPEVRKGDDAPVRVRRGRDGDACGVRRSGGEDGEKRGGRQDSRRGWPRRERVRPRTRRPRGHRRGQLYPRRRQPAVRRAAVRLCRALPGRV
mmetsp:Transcript_4732/g.17659  ORF Transcript_4732/g.17659 Transcript_4732/m.17659 type:complete len:241 (+) Transcript_4732:372-1094(+)